MPPRLLSTTRCSTAQAAIYTICSGSGCCDILPVPHSDVCVCVCVCVCVQTVKGFLDKINGPATEFYEYQGQGHGFMNSDRKDIREKMDTGDLPVGSKEAQEQAWSCSIKFLTQYLD